MAIGTTAAILGAAAIGGGTALVGGKMQSDAAKKQGQAVQQASDQSAATQRYIFDTIRNDTATQRQAGDAATRQIAALMGLNLGPTQTTPGAGTGGGNALNPQSPNHPANRPGYGGLTSGLTGETQVVAPSGGAGDTGPQILPGTGPQILPGEPNPSTPAQSPTDWLRNTPGYQFNFDEGMRALNHGLASRGQLFSGDAGREALRYGQNYGDRIYNQERNALFNLAGMGQVSQGQSNAAGQNYANNQTALNMNTANALGSSYQNSANAWTNALGGVGGAAMWGLGKLTK